MKAFLLIFACLISWQFVDAQLKATAICPTFSVDVMEGSVNELYAKSAIGEIKTKLPCTSETVDENNGVKCGGVFFKDIGIYFYTDRDYIEINSSYKGKITPGLMGAHRNSLFKILGMPKIKDTNWEAFQMGYGTLVLYYNPAGKINKIQISSKTTETLKLCE